VEHTSEYVRIAIHWQGGCTSEHEIVRPVRSYEQLRDSTSSWTGSRRFATKVTPRPRSPTPSTGRGSARRRGVGVRSRPGPSAHGASRPGAIGSAHRATRSARMVATEAGRSHPDHRGEARQLGTPRVGPIAEDARAASLDSLGRRVGVDTTSEAGGLVASWRRKVSGRAHHSDAARTRLTVRLSPAEVESYPR
jgi:hypothetical protein